MYGHSSTGFSPYQGGYPGSSQTPTSYPGEHAIGRGYSGKQINQGALKRGYNSFHNQRYPSDVTVPSTQRYAVDPLIMQWFKAVDVDGNGKISPIELQAALVNGDMSQFSEEACKIIIKHFDQNKSGYLNIQEFSEVFKYVNEWKATFEAIDKDRNGYINFNELYQAFQQMGYRFTSNFIQNILFKYGHRTWRLNLDGFIMAFINIKRLTDGLRRRDKAMQGQATFQYEDFIGLAMGLHP